MEAISRRSLLLLLIGLDATKESEGLGGITRIQKLLFLLAKREGLVELSGGYAFEPYKAGPYSPEVYDDLQMLENLGYINKVAVSEAADEEKAEVDFTFEDLMGPEEALAGGATSRTTPDAYEEAKYCITPRGRDRINTLLTDEKLHPIIGGVRKVKSRFAKISLSDLLYYVYTKYPEMTTESEIKGKVLRKRNY